jgi:hypothetical protein
MPPWVSQDTASLANCAAQKHEPLFAAPQIHEARFVGMQLQTEPIHYPLDLPQRLPGLRFTSRHHYEIIAISNQPPQRIASELPDTIQAVKIDIGKQG